MTTVDFRKASPLACSFDAELGVCVGWACFSKKDGKDYVDAHGDHFPDVELFKAVDALNRIPVEQRAINVEHAGPDRGVIVSAFALTEDFAKAAVPKIDTGGTYGVLVTFKPDAELLKSIKAGESVCLSIEGRAHDVETIAKSAGADIADIAATAHKRTMRQVELTKLAVVKAGAHEGAAVAIVKGAPADPIVLWQAAKLAKRAPALTTVTNGHQHLITDIECADGFTSYELSPGAEYGHSHPFVRGADGAITVGTTDGHTHDIANTGDATMADDLAKSLSADLAKARGMLATALELPADQLAFAKRLDGAALESYLAKSDAERASAATPIHKSERTGRAFFHGEEALVELAKDADAMHAEVAKSRAAAEQAEIAKSAAALPHLVGNALIAKAVHLLPEAERVEAVKHLATINASIGTVTRPIGKGQEPDPVIKSAERELEDALEAFAKAAGKSPDACLVEFTKTAEGKRLYAAAYQSNPTRN